MARRTDHLWADSGDDYTPATDLVFSMFAMTVLLLAMFGAGDHVKTMENVNTIKVDARLIEELRREIDAIAGENRALKQQGGPQRLDAQIRLGVLTEAEVGPFMSDELHFSPKVRQRLLAMVSRRAGDIEKMRANLLLFEIGTSAALGASSEGVDLAMMETMNWAEALMRSLRSSALPVGCVGVVPTGKLHAAHLRALTTVRGAGKSLDDFENLLRLKPVPPLITRELESTRAEDRRIAIWAVRVPLGDCDSNVLSASLGDLRNGR
ncbi:MAG: hypothetical protein HZA66_17595 [Rhodopseudomonas palustris]|uniref:Uncharacterized protein n=1 Tax=Rhodopseudomonas palustris TaxID=1076 RepID=A0A933W2N7_RHOPL|nr:hypothetical protein [Rhodopseudomonas palustris]